MFSDEIITLLQKEGHPIKPGSTGENLTIKGLDWTKMKEGYYQFVDENIRENAPNRFGLFLNIDFESIDDADFKEKQVTLIDSAVAAGVMGLKVYKSLGLTSQDSSGNRIAINDPRLDPVWKACGDNNIPVLIHSGEPASFWAPKDAFNERWLELRQKPGRYRDPEKNPSFEEVLAEQHAVFKKHPNTIHHP